MKKYFKWKSQFEGFEKIIFGTYSEEDVFEFNKILCRDIVIFWHDLHNGTYSHEICNDVMTSDIVEQISMEEYKNALKTAKMLDFLNEKTIRQYFI